MFWFADYIQKIYFVFSIDWNPAIKLCDANSRNMKPLITCIFQINFKMFVNYCRIEDLNWKFIAGERGKYTISIFKRKYTVSCTTYIITPN
jgi:hypothetical protein